MHLQHALRREGYNFLKVGPRDVDFVMWKIVVFENIPIAVVRYFQFRNGVIPFPKIDTLVIASQPECPVDSPSKNTVQEIPSETGR